MESGTAPEQLQFSLKKIKWICCFMIWFECKQMHFRHPEEEILIPPPKKKLVMATYLVVIAEKKHSHLSQPLISISGTDILIEIDGSGM